MTLKITPYHFEELIKKGYSLDVIYLLKLIEQQIDVTPLCEASVKISALYQTVMRKGLISSTGDKLTTEGIELLKFIESSEEKKIVKRKPANNEFEEWWKAYPGTDTFTHKGRRFTGSRGLKKDKEECRIKFDKILLEGEHTASQLIQALEFDVLQKKENSLKSGSNRLTYMQSSITYLNQRSYEPFIELLKENPKIDLSEPTGTTDI